MAAGGPAAVMGVPGMNRPASAKVELANLVGKIHLLTGKPLALNLSDEQRRKVQEQIAGLDNLEDLGEEDAQKRRETAPVHAWKRSLRLRRTAQWLRRSSDTIPSGEWAASARRATLPPRSRQWRR